MYEFTNAENAVIDKLARRLRVAGGLQTAIGLLMLLGGAGRTLALRTRSPLLTFGVDVPVALATVIAGLLMVLVAPSFFAIVRTQGRDIDHVMDACAKLSTMMKVILVVFSCSMAVWLVVFLWLLVSGTPFVGTASAD